MFVDVLIRTKDTRKDGKAPSRIKLIAVIEAPDGPSTTEACAAGGTIRFVAANGSKQLLKKEVEASPTCRTTITLVLSRRAQRLKRIELTASFDGNPIVGGSTSATVTFKAI